ncbi:MAG TPA: hypothetical protein PKZ26_01010 [Anaerolineaceae bacterium]|nr:hypothetical protein [Anaerolineaceae bacterium]NMC18484.1 hypothetical protein [Chloroflexota bacterium]HNS07503.1 hypothetical protein [Anaerolineaceae bacterium]HOE02584.1 hypothetical protein [Anaerolineaceae bacterium]HOQ68577.1 hypothetical protein [Anaerolineaceae bacterium]
MIGVVGVCASGKSTLIKGLIQQGYRCRHIAQEHSYVPDMWYRLSRPDILIFLQVSYEITLKRKNLNWNKSEYETQLQRLQHARQNAHIIIDTDLLTPEELVARTISEIQSLTGNSHSS